MKLNPMRTVVLSVNDNHRLFVQFNEGQYTVKSFNFYNYFGNGDKLTRASDEWIKYGTLPEKQNGLIEV